MKNERMTNEPIRDPKLVAALRRHEGDPPLDAVDWERMLRTVTARAELPLARLRRTATWWGCTAGWARAAIPLAAAAGIALVALVAQDAGYDGPMRGVATEAHLGERVGLTMVLAGDAREREVVDAILGPTGRTWLLDAVMRGAER
jgi:hypothetical protein